MPRLLPPTGVIFVRCNWDPNRRRVQYEPYSRKWNEEPRPRSRPLASRPQTFVASTICGVRRIILGIATRSLCRRPRTKCQEAFWRRAGRRRTHQIFFRSPPSGPGARLRLCRRPRQCVGPFRLRLSPLSAFRRRRDSPLPAGLASRPRTGRLPLR